MSPGVRYTLLRLLLFFGCLAALGLAGLRGLLLVVLAGLLSMVLSLFVLRGLRDEWSARIQQRVEGRLEDRQGAHKVTDDEVEDAELDR
ncbi:DUF4229 domain-containing protein [Arsenicicoccus dermatophilus]|uniref:DUF4229 domain-containing protein n=1 Tax=Arsenicicoccus dermatophilus TaxID=1076331 RepID=UPI001F4CB482|nr:DUF4229 domain-containing protein [Arsenicicoccus dermatophilus]MCH8613859.1 DUF4229 domain-containing protein [Arsenicicoccus dermatophilus]